MAKRQRETVALLIAMIHGLVIVALTLYGAAIITEMATKDKVNMQQRKEFYGAGGESTK